MSSWTVGQLDSWTVGQLGSWFIKKLVSWTSLFILLSFQSYSNFEYNPNCQQAMLAILDLKTQTAREILQLEKKANPQNGYVIYLEHYCESIELIVTEDEKIYEKLIDSYEARKEEMDKLDDGSPYNSWLQAEMLFHTGLAQIKYGTRISGVRKMLGSYNRIKDHQKEYPQFWQNQKLTGTFNIILDFIPPFMSWATDMFGYSGDSDLGISQLTQYYGKAKGIPGLAEESLLFTSLGYKLTWKESEGFSFLADQDKKLLQLTLVKYLFASAASFTFRNDLTLKIIDEIHQDELQVRFYGLLYITGRSKLNHLEKDALYYLERFINDYPGLDYKKDICNRLSYYYLIQGNVTKFEEYRSRVATIGQDLRDRDREAIVESRSGLIPHTGLLKARLLCDGGYFSQADSVIKSIDHGLLSHSAYQLEYYYRKGRICQLTGKTSMAIDEYLKTFNQGKSQPYTYACRSALQLGKIYEEMKNFPQALQWYENCLETYDDDHTADGVEQMADKGRGRVKKKF